MVSEEEVENVAENARIRVTEEDVEELVDDFEEILEMFSKLGKIDTDDVEPAFHPTDVEPESREDETEETLDIEEVFQNTDNEEEGFFKGPGV